MTFEMVGRSKYTSVGLSACGDRVPLCSLILAAWTTCLCGGIQAMLSPNCQGIVVGFS